MKYNEGRDIHFHLVIKYFLQKSDSFQAPLSARAKNALVGALQMGTEVLLVLEILTTRLTLMGPDAQVDGTDMVPEPGRIRKGFSTDVAGVLGRAEMHHVDVPHKVMFA